MTIAFASVEQTTNSQDEAASMRVESAQHSQQRGRVGANCSGRSRCVLKTSHDGASWWRSAGRSLDPSQKMFFQPRPSPREWFQSELVVFECEISPAHTTLEQLREVQELMENEVKVQPQNLEDRIVLMSMYNDIDWTTGSHEVCVWNSLCVVDHVGNFPGGYRSFFGLGVKKKWHSTLAYVLDGAWNRVAEEMVESFGDSGHLVLRGKKPCVPCGTVK